MDCGLSFETKSSAFKDGYVLNIGPNPLKNHSAWTGGLEQASSGSKTMSSFSSRYGSLSMMGDVQNKQSATEQSKKTQE